MFRKHVILQFLHGIVKDTTNYTAFHVLEGNKRLWFYYVFESCWRDVCCLLYCMHFSIEKHRLLQRVSWYWTHVVTQSSTRMRTSSVTCSFFAHPRNTIREDHIAKSSEFVQFRVRPRVMFFLKCTKSQTTKHPSPRSYKQSQSHLSL